MTDERLSNDDDGDGKAKKYIVESLRKLKNN